MLFIDNSANGENAQLPTGNESMPSRGPTHDDDIDHESQTKFTESFNTTTHELTRRLIEVGQEDKLKKWLKRHYRDQNIIKGEISLCIESFTEVAESFIDLRKAYTPDAELSGSIKAAIDILNNTDGVEVESLFSVNAMEVLENDTKRMEWLQMPEATHTAMDDKTSR